MPTRISLFWDKTLRLSVIGSRRFEGPISHQLSVLSQKNQIHRFENLKHQSYLWIYELNPWPDIRFCRKRNG